MEILLRHMLEEMKLRALLEVNNGNRNSGSSGACMNPQIDKQQLRQLRAKQDEMSDIETNTLHAKAIRPCICVRVVHTENVDATVGYIIRVEDIETGLIWLVHKRYSDFFALHKEMTNNILALNAAHVHDPTSSSMTTSSSSSSSSYSYSSSPSSSSSYLSSSGPSDLYSASSSSAIHTAADGSAPAAQLAKQFKEQVVFPSKRLALHVRHDKLIDQRVNGLEHYLRQAMQVCLAHVPTDISAARALRRIQTFLNVDKHIDCIHPPYVDDQHLLERIAYLALTDPDNVACQQINNFLGRYRLRDCTVIISIFCCLSIHSIWHVLNEVPACC